MMIKHSSEVTEERSSLKGTKECTLQWLIAEKDGAEHYAMRLFELKPGGLIPVHNHEDIEHEIFIVDGSALLDDGKDKIVVQKDDVLLVQPGDKHSFINNKNNPFKFICVIPIV